MAWDIHLEITDPEVYVRQLPTIIKHVPHAKDYKIQWRLARLENFHLLHVVWESGSTYIGFGRTSYYPSTFVYYSAQTRYRSTETHPVQCPFQLYR